MPIAPSLPVPDMTMLDRALAVGLGEAAEKQVDRDRPAARPVGFGDLEMTVVSESSFDGEIT